MKLMPATTSVSRMPSSATASSSRTASTVVLVRFSRNPAQPPISFSATVNVQSSSASENSSSPMISGVNGSTACRDSSA